GDGTDEENCNRPI
ncbi:hypothetical protein AVEN_26153-1, partial [Araneus ventricosus]